ncbi:MAG: RICIN domain-containing protein [Akkermansiaceae bacterium]|nr:RICIN domain-containing protein [Armatimonadota bacterium]
MSLFFVAYSPPSRTERTAHLVSYAIIVILLLIGGVDSRPVHADPPGGSSGWVTTFSDDFNGSDLDASKWNKTWINGGTTVGWSQELMKPENVTISGGLARIRQWCNPNERSVYNGVDYGPQNQSGVMTTCNGKFTQTYGYFEARIKMAPGYGNLSAFWMSYENTWPPELDIAEVLGRLPTENNMTQHWGTVINNQHPSSLTMWDAGQDLTATWHTYGCEWNANEIIWYVDGIERKRMVNNINVPMYLELNIHSGNSWAGYPDNWNNPTQHFMEIDWVRGWQRGSGGGNTSIGNGTYRVVSRADNRVMDAYGSGDGGLVGVWDWNGSSNQRWQVESAGNGEYYLTESRSGKLLDDYNNGNDIKLWSYWGGANQRWRMIPTTGGFYRMENVGTGKAVGVNGGILQQQTYSGANSQQWRFEIP